MGEGKDFLGPNAEEMKQLRNDLDGNEPEPRKVAAKRVISKMRAGENMKSLFSSMMRCVFSDDHELKRLVYIYLLTYCSREPEQAIMVVSAFASDSTNENPFVRALAVRTMCRIRLENVAEHMVAPLTKALSDRDPYVRKTAACGVAKLHEVVPDAVENANLFTLLRRLLRDDNATVVANAAAALRELSERGADVAPLTREELSSIVAAWGDGSEWMQSNLTDVLANFVPRAAQEAAELIERLVPFLKHGNYAVVIGTFRVILNLSKYAALPEMEFWQQVLPPILTLVTAAPPEVQYVVLRSLSLLVQRTPGLLTREYRQFTCRYNDMGAVKIEKLGILTAICVPANAAAVLDDLAEYATHVEVQFVRKAIDCIGIVARRIPGAATRCVDVLVGLITGPAEYAMEEAVIVMSKVFRQFPGEFEAVLSRIVGAIDKLKDPAAKAAGIWMLGEYCDLIEHVDVLLDHWVDAFVDEQPSVQLQILTALAKFYSKKPDDARDLLQSVLNDATSESTYPDVRDRAVLYWRVLSAGLAPQIIAFKRQPIGDPAKKFTDEVLDLLISGVGSVSGVLHAIPSSFVSRVDFAEQLEEAIAAPRVQDSRAWKELHFSENGFEGLIDFDPGHLYIRMTNRTGRILSGFALALNANPLGIGLDGAPVFPAQVAPDGVLDIMCGIKIAGDFVGNIVKHSLELALKHNLGVVYAIASLPFEIVLAETGKLTQETWQQVATSSENEVVSVTFKGHLLDAASLERKRVFPLGTSQDKIFFSFSMVAGPLCAGQAAEVDGEVTIQAKITDREFTVVVQRALRGLFAR